MADQVDPPPLFENVDIDVEKEDDLFVSAVSVPQVFLFVINFQVIQQ